MGFSYLDEKCWADITREERFFCQHLFTLAVKDRAKGRAIRVISRLGDHNGNGLADDVEWEPAFEVCFFRDYMHFKDSKDHPYSKHRTFDLAFFSENEILILEAKAHQGFRGPQLDKLKCDCELVRRVTGVDNVWVYGLVSSRYTPSRETVKSFHGPLLTWRDLAEDYDGDEVLRRADCIYNN